MMHGRRGIDLTSGGKAILLQKGIAQEVQWENRDGRIIPVNNGEPVELVPGKTWINVVPISRMRFLFNRNKLKGE